MATVAGPVKQSTTPKNDAFVESQLDRARKRIRLLDLLSASLGFLGLTMAFGLVMALLDNWLDLSPLARGVAFGLYALAAGVYLGYAVILPLSRRINPYYAARKVEETIPEAKNSVVNWLDLHDDEKLPGPIHHAVSQKAARDLARVDMDRAVSGRRAGWAGAVLGILFVLFLFVLFSQGPRQFVSRLGRAFFPWSGASAATSTVLSLIEPSPADITISADQDLTIAVRVEGDIPPEVRLLTRPTMDDPDTERLMEQAIGDEFVWELKINSRDVKNGFHYKVIAGDAELGYHRVSVRSSPFIYQDRFVATYKQREYVGQKVPRVERGQRDLKDLRGTEVTLEVPTNRQVARGSLVLLLPGNNKPELSATIDAKEPHKMRFSFVLESSGKYLIKFISSENEKYNDQLVHEIEARADRAPEVQLTKPGQNVAQPADGQVDLEGHATDDYGIGEMAVQLKVKDGETLRPIPYRSPAEFRLKDGGFPVRLDYVDTIDLAKLKDSQGRPYPLKENTVLEYWLEAKDACDYKEPNVGKSQVYTITITKPKQDEKARQEQQKKAEQRKQEHQKQQDEKLKQENEKRKEEADREKKKQAEDKKAEENRDKQQGQPDQKEGKKQPENTEGKKQPNDPQQPKDPPEQQDDPKKDADAAAKEKKLQDAAEKHKKDKERAEGKPDTSNDPKGEGKQDPGSEKNNDRDPKKDNKGEGKGKPENQPEPGKDGAKDNGKKEGQPEPKQGQGKNEGKPDTANEKKADEKTGEGKQGGEKKSEGKDEGKPQKNQPQKQQGEGKAKPNPDQKEEGKQGQCKEGGQSGQPDQKRGEGKKDGKPESEGARGEQKAGQPGEKDGKPSAGKQNPQPGQRGEGKPAGGQKEGTDKAAQPKDGQQMGDSSPRAEGKQGASKPDSKQGEGKGEPKKTETAQGKPGDGKQNAGQGKAGPKDDTMKQQAGADKKAGQPEEKTASAKDGKVGDKPGERPPAQARKDDVEQLARDMKSNDPAKRGQAQKKLEEIAKDGLDGDARQAAEKELAQQRKEQQKETEAGFDKLVEDLKSDDAKRREQAQKQLDELVKNAKEDTGKKPEGQPQQKQEIPKGVQDKLQQLAKDAQGNDPKKAEEAKKALEQLQKAAEEMQKGKQPMQGGNKMDEFLQKYVGGKNKQTEHLDPSMPDRIDAPNRHRDRAGNLILDRFGDKERKKILRDAGLDEKDVAEIRDYVKRREEKAAGTVKADGKALPTTSIDRQQGGGTSKDITAIDQGRPPREYQDVYREFSKRFLDAQKKKDK